MAKTILIVDDNADAREMLKLILSDEGVSVITAADGQQALDLIDHRPPDLIVTDLQMPNIDGIQMITRIRARPELGAVPIIVMSAFRSGPTQGAMDAGANRSIPKPIGVDAFLSLVRQLLSSEP